MLKTEHNDDIGVMDKIHAKKQKVVDNGHNSCYLSDFDPKKSLINRNLRCSLRP